MKGQGRSIKDEDVDLGPRVQAFFSIKMDFPSLFLSYCKEHSTFSHRNMVLHGDCFLAGPQRLV